MMFWGFRRQVVRSLAAAPFLLAHLLFPPREEASLLRLPCCEEAQVVVWESHVHLAPALQPLPCKSAQLRTHQTCCASAELLTLSTVS